MPSANAIDIRPQSGAGLPPQTQPLRRDALRCPPAAQPAPRNEQEAKAIAVDAFLYFYPLVIMDLTGRQMTNLRPGEKLGSGPSNTTLQPIPRPPAPKGPFSRTMPLHAPQVRGAYRQVDPASRHNDRGLSRDHGPIGYGGRRHAKKPAPMWLSGVPRGKANVFARTPTPDVARAHAPIATPMLGAKLPRGCDLDHSPLTQPATIKMPDRGAIRVPASRDRRAQAHAIHVMPADRWQPLLSCSSLGSDRQGRRLCACVCS
jgi:hypothetical protein